MSALTLFAEGEPKMPTLNWMGREKATNAMPLASITRTWVTKSCWRNLSTKWREWYNTNNEMRG